TDLLETRNGTTLHQIARERRDRPAHGLPRGRGLRGDRGEHRGGPHLRRPRPTDSGERMSISNIPPEVPEPDGAGDSYDAVENAIELKETEGKSQGRIVRERFFRHKGAMISLIVLIAIVLLAFTSIGYGALPGWWKWTPYETPATSLPGGRPTLVMPWSGSFAIGDHPFGQDE